MQNVSVSRRYARALLEATGDSADAVLQNMEALSSYLDAHPDVWGTLSSPTAPLTTRMQVVNALVKSADGMQPAVVNVLKLLTDRNRFVIFPALVRSFRELVDLKLGRVRGRVTSAHALGASQVAAIQASLEGMTQRKVLLETQVDPKILGGVIAQVGSRSFDGSLKTQLNQLGQKMLRPIR